MSLHRTPPRQSITPADIDSITDSDVIVEKSTPQSNKRAASSPAGLVYISAETLPMSLDDLEALNTRLAVARQKVSKSSSSKTKEAQIESLTAHQLAFEQLSKAYIELATKISVLTDVNESIKGLAAGRRGTSTMSSLANDDLLATLKQTIKDQVKAAVNEQFAQNRVPTYAQVSKRASGLEGKSAAIRLGGSKNIRVDESVVLYIEPKEGSADLYQSSAQVETALKEAVNPSDYGLKVSRLTKAKGNSVRIVTGPGDFNRLKDSTELRERGLIVKQRPKINPRLIIRDVPSELSK